MGNLSNLYISQSYTSLVHLGTDGPISAQLPGQLVQLQDGLGNSLGVELNANGDVNITGQISASNIPSQIPSLGQFNAYTASTNTRLNNIESTTASLNSSVTQLNASSASQQVSINALNTYTASFSTASIATSITNLNTFTASANIRLNNIETTTASINSSLTQLNASSASQQVSINALNTFTASVSTASIVTSITNLNTFTSSANIRLNNLESTSASVNISISNLNASSASQQISIDSLNSKTGSYATTGSNTFTGIQVINAAVTASSARIANINYPTTDGTFSGQVMQTNAAGTLSFGNVNAVFENVRNGEATQITTGTPLYVSGAQGDTPIVYRADATNPAKMPVTFVAMENIASGATGRGITLGLITGINMTGYAVGEDLFVDGVGALTNVRPTGSNDIIQPIGIVTKTGNGGQLNVLNPGPVLLPNIQKGYTWVGNGSNYPVSVATSSFGTNVNTGSLLVTASAVDNVITFTKGDASTFQVQVNVSGSQAQIPLGTVSSSAQVLAYGIFVTTSSFNPYTSSTNVRLNNLETTTASLNTSISNLNVFTASVSTASLVTSINNLNTFSASALVSINALNTFTASQSTASLVTSISNLNSATQSLFSSASLALVTASFNNATRNLTFTKGDATQFSVNIPDVSGSTGNFATTGSNTFNGDQTINGFVSASIFQGPQATFNQATINTLNAGNGIVSSSAQIVAYGKFATTGSNVFIGNNEVVGIFQASDANVGLQGFAPTVFQGVGTTAVAYDQFVNGGNYDALHVESNLNAGTVFQDYNQSGLSTWLQIPTNPGTNPKPIFVRGLEITGSTNIAELTASLQNGYVWVGGSNGKTTTVATSSFAGGGASFPYTGSAVITGSLAVTGSVRGFTNTLSVASSTASINMNDGNFFRLNVPTGSTTHVAISNLSAGQTINLLVSQSLASTGSLTFAPNIKFAGGIDYTPTAITGAMDIVSFVSFDTIQIFATQVKNLS